MADDKQNKRDDANGKGKSLLNNFLSAITLIKKEDRFGKLMPKVGEWLKELSGLERNLILEKLGQIKTEEAVAIIKAIIEKQSRTERYDEANSLGLFMTNYDNEKFNKTMLDIEEADETKANVIDSWLLSLDLEEADYFRLTISKMDTETSKKIITSLAKMTDNTSRTNRAKARNLLPN